MGKDLKFCKDCEYVRGDGFYTDHRCHRGIIKLKSTYDLVTGSKQSRSEGRTLDCQAERLGLHAPNLEDQEVCGKEGKFFVRRK